MLICWHCDHSIIPFGSATGIWVGLDMCKCCSGVFFPSSVHFHKSTLLTNLALVPLHLLFLTAKEKEPKCHTKTRNGLLATEEPEDRREKRSRPLETFFSSQFPFSPPDMDFHALVAGWLCPESTRAAPEQAALQEYFPCNLCSHCRPSKTVSEGRDCSFPDRLFQALSIMEYKLSTRVY